MKEGGRMEAGSSTSKKSERPDGSQYIGLKKKKVYGITFCPFSPLITVAGLS